MGNYISILAVSSANNILTNQQAGIVFEQMKNVQFYNHKIKSTVNVAIPSPRMLLDFKGPEFEYCEDYFSGACNKLFDDFEKGIEKFTGKNLVRKTSKTTKNRRKRVIIMHDGELHAAPSNNRAQIGLLMAGEVS